MDQLFQNDSWLFSPWAWASLLGTLALWLLVPRGGVPRWQKALGSAAGVIALGLAASQMPILPSWSAHTLFWLLAAVTLIAAAAMIAVRSPVYSAIWFAMTLLGVAGLFLFQGAQFLGVATIVVYAGAIVVMFLFLIMLAQPQGHEYYDRISWGSTAALVSAVAGVAIVLVLTLAIAGYQTQQQQLRKRVLAVLLDSPGAADTPNSASPPALLEPAELLAVRSNLVESDEPAMTLLLRRPAEQTDEDEIYRRLATLKEFAEQGDQLLHIEIRYAPANNPNAERHVAALGGVLFSRHLLAVELAGTLLLVALVGAIAIVMHGRAREAASQSAVQEAGA